MNIYLCRRPNGNVSLVIGSNRRLLHELLDEFGIPDAVEIFPIKHTVAVHLRLKSGVSGREKITEYLEFEGIDEHSYEEICCAYPVLHEALRKEDATGEQIAEALQQERERLDAGPPDLSDDPLEVRGR